MCFGVFFFISPGALLRVASISASTWRDPYGVAREGAAPAAGAHCPIGHSELCPVGRGRRVKSLGLVLCSDTQRDEGELSGKHNTARR